MQRKQTWFGSGRAVRAGIAAALGCAMAAVASPAAAQLNEIGVGVGIGVPVYETADVHQPGPNLLGYLGYRLSPALQLRGEASFTQLGSDRDTRGDLRIASFGAALVYSPAGAGSGVYGFAGAGAYALRDSKREGDPGLVPGVNLGVGVRARVAGVSAFAQTRLEVPFTTFGTDTESSPTLFVPFTVGVRLPCCGRTADR